MFVTNNYHPYAGGVVKSIDSFVQALRAREYQVYVVTLDFTGDTPQDAPWVIRLRCYFRFKYKNNHIAVPWRPSAQLKALIEELKPDVIHVQHPFFLGHKAALIARRKGIRCLFTYNTMYEDYAHYIPFMPRSLIRKLSISFCNNVDEVIAPSQGVRDYVVRHGVRKPVTVIPSPLRQEFMYREQPEKVRTHRVSLLYVGRLVKEKNVYALLEAFARLPRGLYMLTIVGYGHEEKALKHAAYGRYAFTPDEVIFIHQPSQGYIKEAYRAADLFLFPSHSDTQGLVLAEAMAAGTPVIALDGPGQRDIIEQGKNGFIVATAAAMAEVIEQIRLDPELLKSLQQTAFTTAQHYAPNRCVSRLIALHEGQAGI